MTRVLVEYAAGISIAEKVLRHLVVPFLTSDFDSDWRASAGLPS